MVCNTCHPLIVAKSRKSLWILIFSESFTKYIKDINNYILYFKRLIFFKYPHSGKYFKATSPLTLFLKINYEVVAYINSYLLKNSDRNCNFELFNNDLNVFLPLVILSINLSTDLISSGKIIRHLYLPSKNCFLSKVS